MAAANSLQSTWHCTLLESHVSSDTKIFARVLPAMVGIGSKELPSKTTICRQRFIGRLWAVNESAAQPQDTVGSSMINQLSCGGFLAADGAVCQGGLGWRVRPILAQEATLGAVGVSHAVDAVDLIGTGQAGTALDRNAPHRGLPRPQRSNRRLQT